MRDPSPRSIIRESPFWQAASYLSVPMNILKSSSAFQTIPSVFLLFIFILLDLDYIFLHLKKKKKRISAQFFLIFQEYVCYDASYVIIESDSKTCIDFILSIRDTSLAAKSFCRGCWHAPLWI